MSGKPIAIHHAQASAHRRTPMARKEAALDLWVADRLTECDIEFTPQGSGIKDIEEAL